MWIRRLCLAAVLLLVCAPAWGVTSIELQQSDGTKSAWGGVGDAAKVVTGAPSGVSGTATEAAPTLAEASTGYFSWDLNGNLRISQGTLTSGEDQPNNLLMTSGGVVRQSIVASGITTNTTSAANTIYTGNKSVEGILVCNGGASTNCGITFELRGSAVNAPSATAGVSLCTTVIPTGLATRSEACPVFTANYSFYWIVTTGVAGTSPVLTIYAMD